MEITLPYPPSVNSYKKLGPLRTTKSGKLYQAKVNTEVTKDFYHHVWALTRGEQFRSLRDAVIDLEVDVYPPDKRKRDIDNVLKVLIDSLVRSGLFDDDSQISRILVVRKCTIKSGQIIVRIKELT